MENNFTELHIGNGAIYYSKTEIDKYINTQAKELKQLREENPKLKEALKDIRNQLFDTKNCETILTKSIDVLLKD